MVGAVIGDSFDGVKLFLNQQYSRVHISFGWDWQHNTFTLLTAEEYFLEAPGGSEITGSWELKDLKASKYSLKDFFEQTSDIIWTRQVAGMPDKYMGGTGFGANGAPVRWDTGGYAVLTTVGVAGETVLAVAGGPLMLAGVLALVPTLAAQYQFSTEFKRSVFASYRKWLLTSQFHDH